MALPVPGSTHGLKYSLFYGRPGERLVGYDNERGRGDHRHLAGKEEPYSFSTPEQLIADCCRVTGPLYLYAPLRKRAHFHARLEELMVAAPMGLGLEQGNVRVFQ